MADAYLGIDFGTSGARAMAIDAQHEVVAQSHIEFDEPDQTPAVWRTALFDLISQLPADCRATLKSIAIDGTSASALLCDAGNQPLLPPLMYHDSRASAEARALQAMAPPGHVTLTPSSSLAKLLWFSTQPAYSQARYFTHQADWLAALLHGRPGLSDYHNCLKLGYDVENLCYPRWILKLPVAKLLPQVLAPGAHIGVITSDVAQNLGINKDCRILAGTTDSIAAFLAAGANRPGQAVTSLGSTLALKLLSHSRVEAAQYGIYSHRFGKLWLAGGASNTGGAVLKIYFTHSQLATLSQRINPAHASELDYYPLPRPGERFPFNDPHMPPRLTPRPADDVAFLHGLLESLARVEARGYQLLQKLGATPLTSVLTAGGGAPNKTWTRIRQRLLNVNVAPALHAEAAYGSALLAAKGENLLTSAACP